MKKTIQFIVLAALCLFLSIAARTQTMPLKIGDKVPDITINNIINYKSSSAKLSDFKGKLLILDFWATWCAPCIAMIPRMDSLQRAFEGQVVFLPVTYQAANIVEPFLAKLQQKKSFSLPDVVEDKLLHAMFPHRSLPHFVWISPEGKVIAITSHDQVTAERIKGAIVGKSQRLITKEEMKPVLYDPKRPLFIELNGGSGSSLKYHRLISNYAEGLWPGYKFYRDSTGMRITVRNESLLSLFSLAYGEGKKFLNTNKVILEVNEPAAFHSDKEGNEYLQWMREGNVYCYELIIPDVDPSTAFAAMRQDLDLYFPGHQVTVEKRLLPALVLEGKGENISALKGRKSVNEMSRSGTLLQNGNWNHFIGRLDSHYLQQSKLPLLDDTGITGFVDLEIKADMTDPESINKAIVPFGLSLKPANRMIEVLVIKEKTSKNL